MHVLVAHMQPTGGRQRPGFACSHGKEVAGACMRVQTACGKCVHTLYGAPLSGVSMLAWAAR